MKALVLGATGQVGSAVLRELVSRDADVLATGRRAERGPALAGCEADYLQLDANDADRLRAAVRGRDLVVDAAAPYRLESFVGERDRPPVADAAYERMDRILGACREAGAALAHVSSFATRPAQRDPLDALQAGLARKIHPYFKAKRVMEEEVLAAAESGLRAVVVNPTYCLGPWDAKPPETCLIPQVVKGKMPAAVSHGINVIDVRDVARGLVEAVEHERWGEPILLSGHDLTISSLFARICELAGCKPPAMSAPAAVAAAVATMNDVVLRVAGQDTSQAALAALLVLQQGPTTPSRAQRELGITPRPLSRTLVEAIDWYRSIGYC